MFGFGKKSAEEQMIDAIVQDMVETTRAIAPNIKGKLLALYALQADRDRPISLPSAEYEPTSIPKQTLIDKANKKLNHLQDLETKFSSRLQQRKFAENAADTTLESFGNLLSKRGLELLFIDTNLAKLQICTYCYGINPKRSIDITCHVWDQISIAKYSVQGSIEDLIEQYKEFPDPVRDSYQLPTVEHWVSMVNDLRVEF
jgi:hypothetical protein